MSKLLEANIWKYYLAGFLSNFWFILAINILYWKSFDMSFSQIGWFEFFGGLVIILCEIPTGAFADVVSRKWSVFVGMIITACACVIITTGSSFWVFVFAFMVWGFGDTFISGASSALVYDTLKDLKREKDYLKVQGKYHFITTISLVIGTVISPFLFLLNKRLPYLLMAVGYILGSFIVIWMKEPFMARKKYSIINHIVQMKDGFVYSLSHSMVRWYFLFSVLIALPMLAFNNLISQLYYIDVGFSVASLSILIPIIYGLASFTASQAHRIEKWIGENSSLYVIAFVHTFSFLIMGLLKIPFVLAFVILLYMSRDFRWVVMDAFVNRHISSNMRATVMSVGNMLLYAVMIFIYPFIGHLIDVFSMYKVILGFGLFLIAVSIFLFAIKPRLIVVKKGKIKPLVEPSSIAREEV